MKRSIKIFFILLLPCVFLTGCAELRDKFIPKKKETPRNAKYYAVKTYDVKPSIELYTRRYNFWRTWHKQLLDVLRDDNFKKPLEAVQQAVANLWDMQRMLVDEKAEKMQVVMDSMVKIEDQITKEKITSGNEVQIRRRLEALGREIKRDYNYNKMKGYIRDEFRSGPMPEAAK